MAASTLLAKQKSITELLFGKVKRGSLGTQELGVLTFDATIEETHRKEIEVVDHPIETGSSITDHIRVFPDEIQIRGVVTDQPVMYLASFNAKTDATHSTTNDAYNLIREIMDSGSLVTVVTSLRNYEDMAITSFSVTRDASTANALVCELSLRHVQFASLETTQGLGGVTPTTQAPKPVAKRAPVNSSDKPVTPAGVKVKTEPSDSWIIKIGKSAIGGIRDAIKRLTGG